MAGLATQLSQAKLSWHTLVAGESAPNSSQEAAACQVSKDHKETGGSGVQQ